jgi:hypothetical protein
MKWSTLKQKEAAMLCEKGTIIAKASSALLIPHNTKQVAVTKTQSNTRGN